MVQCYRKKFCVYIERIQREKANGASVYVGIHPSKVNKVTLISQKKNSLSDDVLPNKKWFSRSLWMQSDWNFIVWPATKSLNIFLKKLYLNSIIFSFANSQVCIVKLKMDKDRKNIIDRRAKGRAEATGKEKGKYTEESAASAMES